MKTIKFDSKKENIFNASINIPDDASEEIIGYIIDAYIDGYLNKQNEIIGIE